MKKENKKTIKVYEALLFGMILLVLEFIILTVFITPLI